jgi:adenylosuccinate synthase
MKYSIVLGTQFGDEGKGSFTNWLCTQVKELKQRPLVIRFNGGHQAGHTVLHNGIRHTFSSFGSGTLQNVPTFWSEYCTVYPIALLNEWNKLKEYNLQLQPQIFFDPLCPVTTPYDVFANIDLESKNNHGSVGVGFGTTLKRQESFYKLYVSDLLNKTVLKAKMLNIKNYYSGIRVPDNILENWYSSIDTLVNEGVLSKQKLGFNKLSEGVDFFEQRYDHLIFEGAQGILLDMDFGFFPNVTRSNTTSKNVFNLLNRFGPTGLTAEFDMNPEDYLDINTYYITRPYQTRHGLGFMSNRDLPEPKLINNQNEINIDTSFQGIFRKSILDLDLLNYAIECDSNFSQWTNKKLVISCLDQIEGDIQYTLNGELKQSDINDLKFTLNQLTGISYFKLGFEEGNFKDASTWKAKNRFIPNIYGI